MPKNDALLFGRRGEIGWAGNSGFHAINLAIQFGATRIALVGFDCSAHRGIHWHGRHQAGLNNPNVMALERWRRCLDAQAPLLRNRGVELFVASPDSSLTEYPRRPLMELINALRTPEPAA